LPPDTDSTYIKVALFSRYDVAAFCERDIYGRKSNANAAVVDQAQ
jgi:hypothetical protein